MVKIVIAIFKGKQNLWTSTTFNPVLWGQNRNVDDVGLLSWWGVQVRFQCVQIRSLGAVKKVINYTSTLRLVGLLTDERFVPRNFLPIHRHYYSWLRPCSSCWNREKLASNALPDLSFILKHLSCWPGCRITSEDVPVCFSAQIECNSFILFYRNHSFGITVKHVA